MEAAASALRSVVATTSAGFGATASSIAGSVGQGCCSGVTAGDGRGDGDGLGDGEGLGDGDGEGLGDGEARGSVMESPALHRESCRAAAKWQVDLGISLPCQPCGTALR